MRRAVAFLGTAMVVACTGGADASSSSGDTTDAGAVCVTIDPSTYDRSCSGDSDCAVLPTGKLCTGACGCGGSAVNQSQRSRWATDTASIHLEACPCAAPGVVRCVQNTCTLCDYFDAAPGCPDAG